MVKFFLQYCKQGTLSVLKLIPSKGPNQILEVKSIRSILPKRQDFSVCFSEGQWDALQLWSVRADGVCLAAWWVQCALLSSAWHSARWCASCLLLSLLPQAHFDLFLSPASPFPIPSQAFCLLLPPVVTKGWSCLLNPLLPGQGCGLPGVALVPLGSYSDVTWVRPTAVSSLCRFCGFVACFAVPFVPAHRIKEGIAIKSCTYFS